VGVLPVEAQVETFGEEGYACGVAIDTVKTDGGVACRIAEEVDALVGVGEDATGGGVSCSCGQHHAGEHCFHLFHCVIFISLNIFLLKSAAKVNLFNEFFLFADTKLTKFNGICTETCTNVQFCACFAQKRADCAGCEVPYFFRSG